MPDNLKPLTLMEAASELVSKPSRLDESGFRIDDDEVDARDPPPRPERPERPKQEIESLVGEDDPGSDEDLTTEDDDGDEPSDDDQEVDSEDEDTPTIVPPPSSWTDAEKAEFKKLPEATQLTLSRREADRDKALMQRLNALNEEKQQLNPLAQKLQTEQQNFMQLAEMVFNLGMPEIQEYQNIDWVSLARHDPTLYTERRAKYEDLMQKVGLINNQYQQARQQQQHQVVEFQNNVVRDQYNKLLDEMPELRDQKKAAVILTDINKTMKTYGFSDAELDMVTDHRIIKVLSDLAKYKKNEQTRQSVSQKRSATPAPQMMKPNAGTNRAQNKTVEMKKAMEKLNKTGDIHDAVRVMQLRH